MVVLPSKLETLSSNPSIAKGKKEHSKFLNTSAPLKFRKDY
jgi:hypothetical protein